MITTRAQVQAAIIHAEMMSHNACGDAGEAQNAQQGAVPGLPQVFVVVQ